MYRILEENQELRERRAQRRHPAYAKPELATGPNRVWSWDLTKLRGPVKWTYYYLYVVLDLFSRYVVAWMLAHHEHGTNARALFAQACRARSALRPESSSCTPTRALAELLADLGVERSYSRPQVSDDKPYSEA